MDRRNQDRRRTNEATANDDRRGESRRTGPATRRGYYSLRLKFLVPGTYQVRTIFAVAGLAALLIGIIDVVIYALQEAQTQRILEILGSRRAAEIFASQDRMQMLLVLLGSITAVVAVVAIALFRTHRTAGPLFNLRKTMEIVTQEDRSLHVQFRKGDHFQDLSEAFNRMVDRLDERANAKSARVALLAESLRRTGEDLREGRMSAGESSARMEGFSVELERLRDDLKRLPPLTRDDPAPETVAVATEQAELQPVHGRH